MMPYDCTKFCENISKELGYCADKISIVKFAKGHNSIKNVGGGMILVLCMSFDDALYWYQGW